jgi:ABC-type bacteriocin/lantibiotic exporter with double-glycine peptidase domain
MLAYFIAGLVFPFVATVILFFYDWRLSLCILISILVAVVSAWSTGPIARHSDRPL